MNEHKLKQALEVYFRLRGWDNPHWDMYHPGKCAKELSSCITTGCITPALAGLMLNFNTYNMNRYVFYSRHSITAVDRFFRTHL